jgi:hypothetical protein
MAPERELVVCIGHEAGVLLHGLTRNESPPAEFSSPCPDALLSLELTREPPPDADGLDAVFDSTSLWKVFELDGAYVFDLPHLRAVVDFDAGAGSIHVTDPSHALPFFDYPLDEIIFSKLLADRSGAIVHACGVEHRGRGLLLGGSSGAGKSTLASLFEGRDGARILSDDRVAVRARDGRPDIAGTPWHGTAGHALNRSAPLERILFLEHAEANSHEDLSALEAAERLVPLCVIPWWHRESSKMALDAAVKAVEAVPASVLRFTPDAAAVEHVLGML